MVARTRVGWMLFCFCLGLGLPEPRHPMVLKCCSASIVVFLCSSASRDHEDDYTNAIGLLCCMPSSHSMGDGSSKGVGPTGDPRQRDPALPW